jgi:Domain of unknown function (DUF4375)
MAMARDKRYRMDAALEAKWYATFEREESEGIASLSRAERVWRGVRGVIEATGNGGIISYFYNSWADRIGDSLVGLEEVGAFEAKEQLERVASLFPGDAIKSLQSRNEVINSWNESGHDQREIDRVLEDAEEKLQRMQPDLEEKLFNFLQQSGIAT